MHFCFFRLFVVCRRARSHRTHTHFYLFYSFASMKMLPRITLNEKESNKRGVYSEHSCAQCICASLWIMIWTLNVDSYMQMKWILRSLTKWAIDSTTSCRCCMNAHNWLEEERNKKRKCYWMHFVRDFTIDLITIYEFRMNFVLIRWSERSHKTQMEYVLSRHSVMVFI